MIDENPPRPPNNPPPNNMPKRPAPRKPAARPPNRPGRLNKPPPDVPKPGLPGWVTVRLNGWAVFGAVDVEGGAEYVREPREPELDPPPTRASADEATMTTGIASDNMTASACTKPKARCLNFMAKFLKIACPSEHELDPKRKRPLDGQRRPKEKPPREAKAAARRRGRVTRCNSLSKSTFTAASSFPSPLRQAGSM